MSLSSEKDNFKIKLFSGNEKDWERWEAIFQAVLFQKELGEIVEHLSDDDETPKDDDDCMVDAVPVFVVVVVIRRVSYDGSGFRTQVATDVQS